MNLAVLLFFVHNVLATALLGYKFIGQKSSVFKNFGMALLLDSVAFAIWSCAVVMQPTNLEQYVTIGAGFFIASLVLLFMTSTEEMSASAKGLGMIVAVLAGVSIFYIRTIIYPSAPEFSAEGLFFFNLHPIVQMLYIFGLAFSALPALYVVSSRFKGVYGMLMRYALIAEVMGGIVLLTSSDAAVLYIIGWIMGISYFVLWSTFLLNKKVWSGVK